MISNPKIFNNFPILAGGTIAGIRQIPQVQIGTLPLPPSQIAMHHLNSRTTRHCIPGGGGGIATGISLVDDEVTVETPLMVKRESTV